MIKDSEIPDNYDPAKRDPNWLHRQIELAQADIDTWPEWLRRTAHMEGSDERE